MSPITHDFLKMQSILNDSRKYICLTNVDGIMINTMYIQVNNCIWEHDIGACRYLNDHRMCMCMYNNKLLYNA